jgi:hypothetical protein
MTVFLVAISLEFPTERFLVIYDSKNLVNEWETQGTNIGEGVHSLGWIVEEEERWWKIKIVVGEYQLG